MDFKEELKSSVDIVKVIGEYVRLRKSGVSRYTGLCPFHSEKTPSFSVHAGHQFYKCFGCGAAGDVLKFVMEFEHVSFPEALKLLAERNGIPLEKRGVSAEVGAQFELGYAERSGRTLLRIFERQGFTPEQMENSGLLGRRE